MRRRLPRSLVFVPGECKEARGPLMRPARLLKRRENCKENAATKQRLPGPGGARLGFCSVMVPSRKSPPLCPAAEKQKQARRRQDGGPVWVSD